ncbi:MAG: hypothetical protein EXS38_06950 [Opitutus sp.]|nr:hypothetical protein [Opitutus sp.]
MRTPSPLHHRWKRRVFGAWSLAWLVVPLALTVASAQSVPTSGLVGYWAGNGNANDSSSLANNGSFSGS